MKTSPSTFGAPSIAWQGPPCLQPAEQCSALRAFTRLELLAVLALLSLLAAVTLPALANPRQRSQRVQCVNNLRQIAVATHLWRADHRDTVPWELPVAEGGTRAHALSANVWLHFSWLSNELASPVVLLCPSDTGRPAQDFSGGPAKGYVHPNFANRATSYVLFHSLSGLPTGLMAADRGLGFDTMSSCPYFNVALGLGTLFPSTQFAWSTNLHNQAGNIVRIDGRVDQLSNSEVSLHMRTMRVDDNGNSHYISPR